MKTNKLKTSKQIKEAANALKDFMQESLGDIGDKMIAQIMRQARSATPSQLVNASKGVTPSGVVAYKSALKELMAGIAMDAIDQARKEVPAAKKVKLSEAIMFSDFDRLTPSLARRLATQAELLVHKQIGDLTAVIQFAYAQAEEETDSLDMIEGDLNDSAIGWLEGTALESGASLNAATVINSARNAFFFDDDVLDEIDAFEFVNGDPVTEICQDLAGTIFSKDDPEAARYQPPLHWNCKSSIQPILKGNLGDREIEKLKPSKKSLDDQVLFSETAEKCGCMAD